MGPIKRFPRNGNSSAAPQHLVLRSQRGTVPFPVQISLIYGCNGQYRETAGVYLGYHCLLCEVAAGSMPVPLQTVRWNTPSPKAPFANFYSEIRAILPRRSRRRGGRRRASARQGRRSVSVVPRRKAAAERGSVGACACTSGRTGAHFGI